MTFDPDPVPSPLLPRPGVLRTRLARAMRDVEILRGMLRLAERVAARDGRPATRSVTPSANANASAEGGAR